MNQEDIALIKKRSIHGVVALTSRTFILQIISFFAFLVIASVLPPADLGIYTAVTAIQRVISFFTDFGIGAALIQKKEELTDGDIHTSFTIQFGITLCIFVIIFAARGLIADLFNLPPSGAWLLVSLVFTIFLSSFKTIPSILLERSIRFGKLIIPQVIESLTFNIILIVLVLNKFELESYTYAFLVSALIGVPFYYYVSPWKIGFGINKASLHHLKFGAQFQAKNILATIKDDMLTVILKFLSVTYTQIGYIGFAQRLSFFVYRYIVDSVTKVTFSTYSRIQDHAEHLKVAIEKSLFFVSAIMFPLMAGLIIMSPYIIYYFPSWQDKWEPAILSIVFFSLNAMISSLSGILVNVLDATGRVKTTLKLMVLWTLLTWTLTPILIFLYGYNGVALASFVISLTIFVTIHLAKQVVNFNFIKNIKMPAISTCIMSVVVFVLAKLFVTNLVLAFVVSAIGGIIYCGLMYLLAKDEIVNDVRKIFLKHE
jgi:teichuronic acid exporter